jgi:hypothetical protein
MGPNLLYRESHWPIRFMDGPDPFASLSRIRCGRRDVSIRGGDAPERPAAPLQGARRAVRRCDGRGAGESGRGRLFPGSPEDSRAFGSTWRRSRHWSPIAIGVSGREREGGGGDRGLSDSLRSRKAPNFLASVRVCRGFIAVDVRSYFKTQEGNGFMPMWKNC